MKESADVFRQVLNSPQHPTVKNWCAEIIHLVTTHMDTEEPTQAENNEQLNDEYLEVRTNYLLRSRDAGTSKNRASVEFQHSYWGVPLPPMLIAKETINLRELLRPVFEQFKHFCGVVY